MDKVIPHINKDFSDLLSPILHNVHLLLTKLNLLSSKVLDPLKVLHFFLELLVNIDQILLLQKAFETLVPLLLVRVKDRRGLVWLTLYSEHGILVLNGWLH